MSSRTKGFTLIELLVVISIIAVLTSIVLGALTSARTTASVGAGLQFASEVQQVAGDQAVAYYDMKECAGTNLYDTSGNGYTISGFTGAVAWATTTPSGIGCSLYFSGGSVSLPSASIGSYSGNTPFSISLWEKISSYQSAAVFAGAGTFETAGYGGYFLAETNGSGQLGDPIFIVDNPTQQCGATGPSPLALNQWVNLVGVFDGTNMYLYEDGQLLKTAVCTGGIAPNNNPIHIGTGTQGGWGPVSAYIDNVHLYSKDLVADQVKEQYLAERPLYFAMNSNSQ